MSDVWESGAHHEVEDHDQSDENTIDTEDLVVTFSDVVQQCLDDEKRYGKCDGASDKEY